MRIIIVILLFSIFPIQAFAQFESGDVELSFTMNINNYKEETEPSSTSNDETTFFYLNILAGFYVAKGLAFEPELAIYAIESGQPTSYMIANMSYTHQIKIQKLHHLPGLELVLVILLQMFGDR